MAITKKKSHRDIPVEIMTFKEAEINDDLYWNNTTPRERFCMVTEMREYFYGKKATTGRVQRVCTMFKRA